MNVKSFLSPFLMALTFVALDEAIVWAQPTTMGGPEAFMSRMLRRVDRNEDGMVDVEELERSGAIREFLIKRNVGVDKPIPVGVIESYQPALLEDMQQRFAQVGISGPPAILPGSEDRRDRGERGFGGRSDFRGGRRGDNTTSTTNPVRSTPPKSKGARYGAKIANLQLTLPAQYISRDANGDGQIGMYEWSKTDLSTFRKLDLNGDGFLVAAELGATSGSSSRASSTTLPIASSTIPPAKFPSASSGPLSTSPPGRPTPPSDPKVAAAETAFVALDVNKNEILEKEEFDRSRVVRKMFQRAKVEFSGSMSKKDFVDTYVKLST